MRHRSASLGVAALLSFAAGCDSHTPPPRAEPLALEPLLERIDRLVATMQANAAASVGAVASLPAPALPAAAASPPEAVRVAASDGELVRRVEALEFQLGRLVAASAGARVAPYAGEPPPKATGVIARLLDQLIDERLRGSARRTVFRLDEEQVLQRFGVPDQVRPADQGQVIWRYEDGKRTLEFLFLAGLVVNAWAST